MTHSYEYRTLLSGSLFWLTHSPEHFLEKPTLLGAFLSVLLFWAISWALLGARQKMGALFWGLKRVLLLSRAFFWVGLLSRALFWGLFRGLSVHQNLNALSGWKWFLEISGKRSNHAPWHEIQLGKSKFTWIAEEVTWIVTFVNSFILLFHC